MLIPFDYRYISSYSPIYFSKAEITKNYLKKITQVFVGNLPFNATEKELQEIFQNHGPMYVITSLDCLPNL